MSRDPVLDFYNESNRTDHPNWDFDTTGYLERSMSETLYWIKQAILTDESEDTQA
jgi:hypothetical protein